MVDREKYFENRENAFFMTDLIDDKPENGIVRQCIFVSDPFLEVQWLKGFYYFTKIQENLRKL